VSNRDKQKQLRICLAASAGGHISQLLKLAASWNGYETFCVTTTEVIRNKLNKLGEVYVVGECNRQHPIRVVTVFLRCIRIVLRERPDVVISTGAAAGCMLCFLGKMIGAKVVWVDSITNVERISLSGRMVRYIADLFLVQWPELASRNKKVEFVGTVI
jgi:UDP-N-acetylglucosamine:LPS N-acetylglucosamine transferase